MQDYKCSLILNEYWDIIQYWRTDFLMLKREYTLAGTEVKIMDELKKKNSAHESP